MRHLPDVAGDVETQPFLAAEAQNEDEDGGNNFRPKNTAAAFLPQHPWRRAAFYPRSAEKAESSKTDGDMLVAATACGLCLICSLILIVIAIFVLLCVLLARDNTPEVHQKCGGLWDFVMVLTVLPFMMPLAYCILTGCGTLCNSKSFSCVVCAIMASMCVYFACTASGDCVKALGDPPLLMYVVYIKAVGHGIGALGALSAIVRHSLSRAS